jgi:LDH2 family malate/lactate/ureidoglycolate dehydrogenase
MAINVEAFVDVDQFKKTTGDILRDLKNSQKIPGHDKIYVAGEKEFENEKKIKEVGIPINDALQKNIKFVMEDLGITDIDLGF